MDAPEFELISGELYTETQSVLVDIIADPMLVGRLVVRRVDDKEQLAITESYVRFVVTRPYHVVDVFTDDDHRLLDRERIQRIPETQ